MNKLYNTTSDIATNLSNFFSFVHPSISKPKLKLLPNIIISMIDSESVVSLDIIKKLKHPFFLHAKTDSTLRRFRRFFNSLDSYSIYDSVIKHVISNYKPKHSDNRIHITFDHSFCNDKFTILSFNLRIGKQSIPLFFRCFKGRSDSNAYIDSTIISAVKYICDLFKPYHYDLIFLADRFFPSSNLFNFFISNSITFCIRLRSDSNILIFDKREKHYIWKSISDIKPFISHSKKFNDVFLFNSKVKINLAVAPSSSTDDPWYIATNGDVNKAIKDYSYRFGAIESHFKNQKSNGFYLESTNVRKLSNFIAIFSIMNIAILWLTILGSSYCKNKSSMHNLITDVKRVKGVKTRMVSLFNLGLIFFNLAYNSLRNITIKYNFLLYDV